MGFGIIFGVLAAVWLGFLMPWFLSQKDVVEGDEVDLSTRVGRAMKVVKRSGRDEVVYDVSTPLMRRAARREIRDMARRAARRRLTVLLVLLVATIGLGVASGLKVLPWWPALVPGALLLGFIWLAHVSVTKMNARLDARLAQLDEAEDDSEDTVMFKLSEMTESTEMSIELSAPVGKMTGSLWDPIPVTTPTYLAKPLVPRTVRTIDLSAPEPTMGFQRVPVVAEARVLEGEVVDATEAPRAVNE